MPDHVSVDVSALQAVCGVSAALGRLVLNVLLLAADSLPEGGEVILAGATDDLFVRIAGAAAAWPAGMALCLANETEAQTALGDEPDSAIGRDSVARASVRHTIVCSVSARDLNRAGNFAFG